MADWGNGAIYKTTLFIKIVRLFCWILLGGRIEFLCKFN